MVKKDTEERIVSVGFLEQFLIWKKRNKEETFDGPIGEDAQPNLLANLCLVWGVYPCRCPTAEWRLRDKRDNAPRQGVPERQRSRARGDKKKYAHAVLPLPACMTFDSWGNRTHGRWAMHAHHCSRARPTPERSSAFASSPVVNCDTCKIFFRAILPNFSGGVIWHTDRGGEKKEGEGG